MSVEVYLNKGIKEIMTEFPAIGKILDDFNIGCRTCGEGLCLLKDILEIHDIDPEEQEALMGKVAKIIFPNEDVKIPITRRERKSGESIKYSPPMKKLVDEHVLIKRWLALIPKVVDNLNLESEEGRAELNNGIDFIRNYADKYHHAKEEDELFKYFNENLDILKVIRNDHVKVRSHVKAILEGIEKKDTDTIKEHLNAYKELLPEHIKKEDEILYTWMDRSLTDTHIGELYSKFNEIDEQYKDAPKKHENFIVSLENKYC